MLRALSVYDGAYIGWNKSSVHYSFVTSEASRSVPKCDRTAPARGQRNAERSSGRLGNSLTFLRMDVLGRGVGAITTPLED
jgi:hypothetical protein